MLTLDPSDCESCSTGSDSILKQNFLVPKNLPNFVVCLGHFQHLVARVTLEVNWGGYHEPTLLRQSLSFLSPTYCGGPPHPKAHRLKGEYILWLKYVIFHCKYCINPSPNGIFSKNSLDQSIYFNLFVNFIQKNKKTRLRIYTALPLIF